jgi:hypothetical protein
MVLVAECPLVLARHALEQLQPVAIQPRPLPPIRRIHLSARARPQLLHDPASRGRRCPAGRALRQHRRRAHITRDDAGGGSGAHLSKNGTLLGRGGGQNRWHSLVNCNHGGLIQ